MIRKRYILVILILFGLSCINQNRKNSELKQLKSEENQDTIKSAESEEVFSCVEEMPIFEDYEEMAEFGERTDDLKNFFLKRLIYPQSAIDDSIQGRVFIQFVVERDGKISNVKVIRGVREDLDNEVVRVANQMPKWKPGKQMGKPVRVSYVYPVTFSLKVSLKKGTVVYPTTKENEKV